MRWQIGRNRQYSTRVYVQKFNGSAVEVEFTWGEVLQVYHMAGYSILKFKPNRQPDEVNFHIYIDGEDTSRYAYSLEEAMITAIVYRFGGCNSQAAEYICKSLGIIPVEQAEVTK